LAARELVATLSAITAGFDPVPQPTDGITLAPKLTVDEVRLDWSAPRHAICGLVRGANPNPGAWTLFRGERLKILRATSPLEAVPGAAAAAPGTLINTKRELLVTCGESSVLRLDQVQPVGKKPMTGADWARGIRIQAGERFG
ncbi:MAG: methionyl-tRNA formyltransferase, partial [Propionibacteriaceae bacterium]|nr:methionyl-tRNA formyltransferase [Propionibacteriaceae bacterium]